MPSDSGGGYVGWEELRIGQPITVYGRTLFLTNCDGFTREYYATKVCQHIGRRIAPLSILVMTACKRAKRCVQAPSSGACHRC